MQNYDDLKLKECLWILDKLMCYTTTVSGADLFEILGGSIEMCAFCKIPFFDEYEDESENEDNDEEDNGEEDNGDKKNIQAFEKKCIDYRCTKKWCGRSEFCTPNLEECNKCCKYICKDHINHYENEDIILCRECYWNKKLSEQKIKRAKTDTVRRLDTTMEFL